MTNSPLGGKINIMFSCTLGRETSDTIADLRRRLDQSEQERRDKDRQLTALLTDQRGPERRRRWWQLRKAAE